MRKTRHHPAHGLVVRGGAKGEVCGLVLRRAFRRAGSVLPEREKNQARRPDVTLHRCLQQPAVDRLVLGDRLDRVTPLDLHKACGLPPEGVAWGRLASSTTAGITAPARLELVLRRRLAITDIVLPGRFGGLGRGHQTSPSRWRWPVTVAKVSPVSSRTGSPRVVSCQRRMMPSQ